MKVTCKHCNKEVTPIVRVFNTTICPQCNKIMSSDYSIEKNNK